MRTVQDRRIQDYDFLDFGAGVGGSIVHCERRFGGRGLGIEINEEKIAKAQAAGHEVVFGDVHALGDKPLVRYVSMNNVLEHLPDFEAVERMIATAVAVARDFVYIVHPSFEEEHYLRTLGLKQYWHDWHGHPSHVLLSDFVSMFRAAGIDTISLEYIDPVWSSEDSSILPINAPRDQHQYDEELHGPKPVIEFSRPIHRQLRLVLHKSSTPDNTLLRGSFSDRLLPPQVARFSSWLSERTPRSRDDAVATMRRVTQRVRR